MTLQELTFAEAASVLQREAEKLNGIAVGLRTLIAPDGFARYFYQLEAQLQRDAFMVQGAALAMSKLAGEKPLTKPIINAIRLDSLWKAPSWETKKEEVPAPHPRAFKFDTKDQKWKPAFKNRSAKPAESSSFLASKPRTYVLSAKVHSGQRYQSPSYLAYTLTAAEKKSLDRALDKGKSKKKRGSRR